MKTANRPLRSSILISEIAIYQYIAIFSWWESTLLKARYCPALFPNSIDLPATFMLPINYFLKNQFNVQAITLHTKKPVWSGVYQLFLP